MIALTWTEYQGSWIYVGHLAYVLVVDLYYERMVNDEEDK